MLQRNLFGKQAVFKSVSGQTLILQELRASSPGQFLLSKWEEEAWNLAGQREGLAQNGKKVPVQWRNVPEIACQKTAFCCEDQRIWLPFFGWSWTLGLAPPFWICRLLPGVLGEFYQQALRLTSRQNLPWMTGGKAAGVYDSQFWPWMGCYSITGLPPTLNLP